MSEKQKPGSPIEKRNEYQRDENIVQQSDNSFTDRQYDDTRTQQSNGSIKDNTYVAPETYSTENKYEQQPTESVPIEQSEVYDTNYDATITDQQQYQQEYDQQYTDQQYDPNYTTEGYDGQYDQQQYDEQQQQQQQEQPYDANQQYEQYPSEYDGTYASEQTPYTETPNTTEQTTANVIGGAQEQSGYTEPNQSNGNVGQVYTGPKQPTGGTGNNGSSGGGTRQQLPTTELLQK